MVRVVVTLIFALLVSTNAWAGNWNKGKILTGPYGEYWDYESGYELPERPKRKPDKITLKTYLQRYIDEPSKFFGFKIPSAANPSLFEFELREEALINEQLQKTSLISYLLYEDGKIVVDELTPPDRFGDQVSDDTPLPSRSIGKSLTGYLLGHAICEGYIDGVDSKLNDWDWVKDTIYEGQTLIDLVNMRAGDQGYAHKNKVFLPGKRERHTRARPLTTTLRQLKGTTPNNKYYNYNDLVVMTLTNYIRYKTGNNYRQFTTDFLQKKIGIAFPFYVLGVDLIRGDKDGVEGVGSIVHNFSASRYDFLRIARTMLNDWQNNTCEGKYLKAIFERQMPKDRPDQNFQRDLKRAESANKSFRNYGGYFHIGLAETGKNRHIIGMDGYGGQMIWIDFDEGRIVVTNAIYNNYDWKKIVRDVIRKGKNGGSIKD